jgi:hypothetical protein
MQTVIQATYLSSKLKLIADLKDEAEFNSFLTPVERATIKQRLAALNAGIAQERGWNPSAAVVDELERVEHEANAFGTASYAANLHQVRDIVSNPAKGTYHPLDDDSLRAASQAATAKLAKLCEKYRVPVNGLEDLKRWGLLDGAGRYIGGIGSK